MIFVDAKHQEVPPLFAMQGMCVKLPHQPEMIFNVEIVRQEIVLLMHLAVMIQRNAVNADQRLLHR